MYQCTFAAITYVFWLYVSVYQTSYQSTVLSSLLVQLPSVDALALFSFSCLSGLPSYMILLHVGRGIPMAGHLSWVALILPEAPRFTLSLELLLLPFLSIWENAVVTALSVWRTSLTTRLTSWLALFSSGSVGSVSMVVLPSLRTSGLFKLVSLPTSLPLAAG